MKSYIKPEIKELVIEIEDVIASSTLNNIINTNNQNDVIGGFGKYN